MGALRINLTDGTSTFIDLTGATSVAVQQSTVVQFDINVSGTVYTVKRFLTENTDDSGATINGAIWEGQMLGGYTAIAADPIRYGYPNLGSNLNTYIQYDDEKFLAAAIDSALSNVAEPAVLSNRTARAINVQSDSDGKATAGAITDALDDCKSEAETERDDCLKAVADAACSGGFDFTNPPLDLNCPCDDTACCYAAETQYIRACISTTLDAVPLKWEHQYLFASVETGEEEGGK